MSEMEMKGRRLRRESVSKQVEGWGDKNGGGETKERERE